MENKQEQVNINNPISNQKGNALLIITIVVLMLVIGTGGYFLYQKQINKLSVTSQQTSSLISDKTVNWNTYTNERYSLKYPKELTLKAPNSSGAKEIGLSFPGTDSHGSSDRIRISQEDNTYNRSSLDTFLKMDAGITEEGLNRSQLSTINGANARRFLDNKDVMIYIQYGQSIYFLHYFPDSAIDNHEENIKTLDAIVSTLTFTRSASDTKDVKIIDGDIYVIKDGKETKITSWGYNFDPVLSPDSTKIAYLSKTKESIQSEKTDKGYKKTSANVWIVNTNGNNPIQVTQHINFVYRGNLHWLDNNRLLFTDGTQSAKVYSVDTKLMQTVLGPATPEAVCLDACGFTDVRFFYNKDYSYLVRIEDLGNGTSIIVALNTQTLKGTQLPEQQFSANLGTVSFSADNKILFFEASTSSNQQKQVSIDLTTQQVNIN